MCPLAHFSASASDIDGRVTVEKTSNSPVCGKGDKNDESMASSSSTPTFRSLSEAAAAAENAHVDAKRMHADKS
jgi:hypothetical protein